MIFRFDNASWHSLDMIIELKNDDIVRMFDPLSSMRGISFLALDRMRLLGSKIDGLMRRCLVQRSPSQACNIMAKFSDDARLDIK